MRLNGNKERLKNATIELLEKSSSDEDIDNLKDNLEPYYISCRLELNLTQFHRKNDQYINNGKSKHVIGDNLLLRAIKMMPTNLVKTTRGLSHDVVGRRGNPY